MTDPTPAPVRDVERQALMDRVRKVAHSLPPSDFGSHRAMIAVADLVEAETSRLRKELEEARAAAANGIAEQTRDAELAARLQALEEAAKVAERCAQDFLSPQYATPQPVGSIQERFACSTVADNIRSLSKKSETEGA